MTDEVESTPTSESAPEPDYDSGPPPTGSTGEEEGSDVSNNTANEWAEFLTTEAEDEEAERLAALEEDEVPAPAEAPVAETPVTGGPVAPVVTPSPVAPTPLTPEQIAAQQEADAQARAERFQFLTNQYTIPDSLKEELITSPETVLPKLAAVIHENIMQQVLQVVPRIIPEQVRQTSAMDAREKSAKEKFYSINPDLAAHEEQVLTAGQFYRKINPTADPDTAAKAIGNLVRSALGLPSPSAPATSAPPPAKAASRPFRPASAGGTAAAPKPAKSEWEELIDFD